jgi:hypothetical protein
VSSLVQALGPRPVMFQHRPGIFVARLIVMQNYKQAIGKVMQTYKNFYRFFFGGGSNSR